MIYRACWRFAQITYNRPWQWKSKRQQISLTLHWLRTRSDFSNTETSLILHCNVLVSAYIIMNYSSSTSCNTIRCNVVQTAACTILSRLHCNAQIEAAYIIFLLSRRWASTHLALSHRQLVHLLAPKVLFEDCSPMINIQPL